MGLESAQGVRVGDGASIRAEQQARRLTLLRAALHFLYTIANEECIADLREPSPAEGGDHVMRHVLLVADLLVSGHASQQSGHHITPVVRLRGDHLLAHRMNEARMQEVCAVERLIDHRSVGTSAEGAHHRRGDVAGLRKGDGGALQVPAGGGVEDAARKSSVGLWADSDPIPPWEWRKAGNK